MTTKGGPDAYLLRIPIADRVGTYAAHRKVYEMCGRESRPLWRRCPGYLLALTRAVPQGAEARPYAPCPVIGQETRFDLLAEVAVGRKKDGQIRSRRCDPILEAHHAEPSKSYAELALAVGTPWLERQGARLGFDALLLDRCDYEVMEFVRDGRPIRIGAVRFSGQLRVTSSQDFKTAMLGGIGHGKAWGCGLLLCFRN